MPQATTHGASARLMSDTPRHIGEKVDRVLDQLNANWDLRLPRLYKADANRSVNDSAIARRCSSRIRFLCFRIEEGIDAVVAEFEEDAKYIFSRWVWKPSQERNTLPSSAEQDSFLRRDIISRKARRITPELREQLLSKLALILDQEYKLARDSESYKRTASQEVSTTSRQASFAYASGTKHPPFIGRSSETSINSKSSKTSSNKRRKTSGETQDDKRQRTQPSKLSQQKSKPKIDDLWRKSKSTASSNDYTETKVPKAAEVDDVRPVQLAAATFKSAPNCQSLLTSFNTTVSADQNVFSEDVSFASCYSGNTSPVSTTFGKSQDLFNTQDAEEYLADVSFMSELDAANSFKAPTVFDYRNIEASSPFKPPQALPAEAPFWLRWEVYRMVQIIQMTPKSLYDAVTAQQNSACTYDHFWKTVCALCKERDMSPPGRSGVKSWMETSDMYESSEGETAYFTFSLEYNYESGPDLWRLVLHPIKVDKGNRIHRKFGPDRHVIGFLNYFDASSLPKWVTRRSDFDANHAFEQIGSWLATAVHHIAGREWRAFYLEPEKKQKKKGKSEIELPRQKLSLFAIDGIDLGRSDSTPSLRRAAISITDFVNWHIPFYSNLDSTDLKLFSRFGLGLSKTRATIVLKPEQVRHVQDTEPVMDDGFALISTGMGRAIWEICGDGTTDVPSVFQGRCGGTKGLWGIDYRDSQCGGAESVWMQASDSQLKIKPHPKDRLDADTYQRTFEVLKWSNPCAPGHLNIQLINILADRGVPRLVLRQVVLDDIEEYIEASRAAMRDPRSLQAWLQDYHSSDRHERPVNFDYGLPETKEEEVCFLVQSGFTAEKCEFLRRGVVSLVTQRLNSYVERLRIEIPHSTTVFCIPDPYQVLEEDEVFMGFSNHWQNPKTGFKETALIDIDVLVARNPAALASDIQKRRAVYKHDLRHFKNVIVFPTKGRVPLASLLSGGDYDGDTVTVIWDPKLVDSFNNVEKPKLPSEEQCGLQKVSRRLAESVRNTPATEEDVNRFLTYCVLFNAKPNRLGLCTNEHEKLVYNGAKLTDHGAILLAALSGYLVDAPKQGLSQTSESWFQVRKTAQAGRKLLPLAYKSGENLPRRGESGECINVMDHLKFDVAMKRKESIMVEFEKMLKDAQNYDPDLTALYRREDERSRMLADPENKSVAALLDDLKRQLGEVNKEWIHCSTTRQSRRKDLERSDISSDIRSISQSIQRITPRKCDCDIYRDWLREEGSGSLQSSKGTRWSLLRASTMYKLNQRNITWWTVGDELGRIKARSLGMTREITPGMHHLLRADSRFIHRLVGESLNRAGSDLDE